MNNNNINNGINKFLNALRNTTFLVAFICAVAAIFLYLNMDFVSLDLGFESFSYSGAEVIDSSYVDGFAKLVAYLPILAAILSVVGFVTLNEKLIRGMAVVGMLATPVEFFLLMNELAERLYMEFTDFEFSEIAGAIDVGVYVTIGIFVVLLVLVNKIEWRTLVNNTNVAVNNGYTRCPVCGVEHPIDIDCPRCKPAGFSNDNNVKSVSANMKTCRTCGKTYDANKYTMLCPHCNSPL